MIQADDKNTLILDEFMMRNSRERAGGYAVSRKASASEEGQLRMQVTGELPLTSLSAYMRDHRQQNCCCDARACLPLSRFPCPTSRRLHRRFFSLDDLPQVSARGRTGLGPPEINAQAQTLSFRKDTGMLAHRLIQNHS